MKIKTSAARLVGAAMLAAAVTPLVGVGSAAAAEDCPAGTTMVAKFQNNGGAYTLDAGTAGVVTISNGTNSGGNFTSTTVITAVFVKGGTADKTDLYPAGVFSGSFSSSGLVNDGGQVPAISHVTFCTGPTTSPSPSPSTSTTPASTPASTPATTPPASVLPTKASSKPSASVAGVKNQKPPAVLPHTGSGMSLGMALAVSFGLLLGGAALMFAPRGLTVQGMKGKRRRH